MFSRTLLRNASISRFRLQFDFFQRSTLSSGSKSTSVVKGKVVGIKTAPKAKKIKYSMVNGRLIETNVPIVEASVLASSESRPKKKISGIEYVAIY